MIKIENIDTYGWESAIRGMRNPMNSWDKSDSRHCDGIGCYFEECSRFDGDGCSSECDHIVGPNDLKLMKQLVKAGTDHSKFMRMINVTCDITAPLYWWKEFDTYKVGTVRNSCSTMHKIAGKEFTLDDFSHEHLFNHPGGNLENVVEIGWERMFGIDFLDYTIKALNVYRKRYLETKDKQYWWQMIQLLPSSYNQRATVAMNYAVLRNIYHSRKAHRLDEWRTFCEWIETLPYSELITEGN